MAKYRYEEGGDVDPLEEANKGENLDTTPGPKAEPETEKPKPRAKATPPARKPAAKASAPSPTPQRVEVVGKRGATGDEYSGRARLAQRFGTAETRANVKPDIKAEDVASAKKAGEERRTRDRENLFTPLRNTLKSIGARVGSQETRERLKAEGYANGGKVRGGGCEQRGKTKGRMV